MMMKKRRMKKMKMSEKDILNDYYDCLGARYEQLARLHNTVEIVLSKTFSTYGIEVEPDSLYQTLKVVKRIVDEEIIENLQKRDEIHNILSKINMLEKMWLEKKESKRE